MTPHGDFPRELWPGHASIAHMFESRFQPPPLVPLVNHVHALPDPPRRATIWMERQNKPSLVVKDLAPLLAPGVSRNAIYESLLRRGVFKWLAVRRDLIRLKNLWKTRVTESIARQKADPAVRSRDYERGYRDCLQVCRAEIRALCHSPRWQAPDHDPQAVRWLEGQA